MRRGFAILLTVMLTLASFASAAHATPHGHVNAHEMADGASEMAKHAAAPVEAVSSCCAGEIQRTGPSCAMLLAVLPADPSVSQAAPQPLVFAMATAASEGLDPERLLDPPRS